MIRSLALALVLAVAACAERPEVQAAPPENVPLNRTQWTSADGGWNAPTLEFVDSRANGFTGCNRFFAQVEQNGPALTFTGVGTTRRACSPDLMQVEQNFVTMLEGTRAARLEGDTLVLLDVNDVEIARLQRKV